MFDVIVVGARVAGSPLAMMLARQGRRVLLLDKARFPSDTMSTHFVQVEGVQRLDDWGLLERVEAAGTPPVRMLTVDVGFARIPVPQGGDGGLPAYCPRRTVLDTILVRAAVEAGAELREEFSVQELLFEDGRVAGVRGRSKGGGTVEERAGIVVGADGKHSFVAKAVGAGTYDERPSLGCGYYAYFSGIAQEQGAELHLHEGNALFLFPTNDGRTCIAVEWPNERFHEVRADIEGSFFAALDRSPGLAERVRAGTQEERFIGSGDLPNFFRTPHGPGWALVGDAGYHKDPVTGDGITDAFIDAELLADALEAGLSGRTPMDESLAAYEQRRNAIMRPRYERACATAQFRAPGPELFQVLAGGGQAQPAA